MSFSDELERLRRAALKADLITDTGPENEEQVRDEIGRVGISEDQYLETLRDLIEGAEGGAPITFVQGEPDFLGDFPLTNELTVLPADNPREPIGWTCLFLEGAEVYKIEDGEPVRIPLTQLEDIQVGVPLLVHTLVGLVQASVVRSTNFWWWESDGLYGDLLFDTDDRHCWVTTMAINKRARV